MPCLRFARTVTAASVCVLTLHTLAACTHATATSARVTSPALPESARPRELARGEQVAQALSRLTYGARAGDTAEVARVGLDRWIRQQLTPENWPDRAADSALARAEVLLLNVRELVDSSPPRDVYIRRRRAELGLPANGTYNFDATDSVRFKAMSDLGNRRVQQFQSAKLTRAVVGDHQLLEVMTDFWENHFSVFRGKMPTQFSLLQYDRDVIRPRALGNFRDLLGAVAHSPAMLYYLDNYQSTSDSTQLTLVAWQNLAKAKTASDSARIRASAGRRRGGLNENYGRELLELHTLGVDGGYSQADVQNVARALTGWSLRTPREGGDFQFNANAHDAGEKQLLGFTLRSGRGEEDGEEVLDILARHPSTARYIATKLVRHFVADTAPVGLVERAAREFTRSAGDIRRTMALIISSPEFYSRAARDAKVKTPYQLVVSTYRSLGVAPDSSGKAVALLTQLGQPFFGRQTPDGWPDDAASWLNTGAIRTRINFAVNASNGRIPGTTKPVAEPLGKVLIAPAFQRR